MLFHRPGQSRIERAIEQGIQIVQPTYYHATPFYHTRTAQEPPTPFEAPTGVARDAGHARKMLHRALRNMGVVRGAEIDRIPGMIGGGELAEAGIWREARGHSVFTRNVQATVSSYLDYITNPSARKIIGVDIETLGAVGDRIMTPTEIAFTHSRGRREYIKSMLVRPDDASLARLKTLAGELQRDFDDIGISKAKYTSSEWRALRDLMRFSPDAGARFEGSRLTRAGDVYDIAEGTDLAQYAKKINQGLRQLQRRGLDPKTAAEQLNDYVRRHSDAVFVGHNIAQYDKPFLQAWMGRVHPGSKVGQALWRNQIDTQHLVEIFGLHRDITDHPSPKGLEAIYRHVTGQLDAVEAHIAVDDARWAREVFERLAGREDLVRGLSRFDAETLRPGSELLTTKALHRDTASGDVGRGAYDFLLNLETGRRQEWFSYATNRNTVYEVIGMHKHRVEGRDVHSLYLKAKGENVLSVVTRETPEDIAHAIHSTMVSMDTQFPEFGGESVRNFYENQFLTREALRDIGDETAEGITRRNLDSAQRMYRRMYRVGEGGINVAEDIYTMIGRFRQAGLDPTDLRGQEVDNIIRETLQHRKRYKIETYQNLFRHYGPRLYSEHDYASELIRTIKGTKDLQYFSQQSLAFAMGMERLPLHVSSMELMPWQRQIEVLDPAAPLGDTRPHALLRERGRYSTVTVGVPERTQQELFRLFGRQHGQPESQAQRLTLVREILKDFRDRGVLTREQTNNIIASGNAYHKQLETLSNTLANLSPRVQERAIMQHANVESLRARPLSDFGADAKSTAIATAREVSAVVMNMQKGKANLDEYFRSVSGKHLAITGQPIRYSESIRSIIKTFEDEHLKVAAMGLRDQHGKMAGVNLVIHPKNLYNQVHEAIYRGGTDLPAGAVPFHIPLVDEWGHVKFGRKHILGITTLVEGASPASAQERTFMETVSESISEKSRRISSLIYRGEHVQAQQELFRIVGDRVDKASAFGHLAYQVDPSIMDVRMTVSDYARGGMVDLRPAMDLRLDKVRERKGYVGIRDRYEQMMELYRDFAADDAKSKRFFVTGKEDDIVKGLWSRADIRDFEPLGHYINPSRANIWQYQNMYALDASLIDNALEQDPYLRQHISRHQRLTTTTMDSTFRRLTRQTGEDFVSGLTMRGVIAQDVEIREAMRRATEMSDEEIMARLRHLNIDEDAVAGIRQQLRDTRFRMSTYENMMLMSDDVAPLFRTTYTEQKAVTADLASDLGRALDRAEFETGRREVPLTPELRRQLGLHGEGAVTRVAEDAKGFRAIVRASVGLGEGDKIALSGGEKGTVNLIGRTIMDLLFPKGTSVVYYQDVAKHGDVGALAGDQIRKIAQNIMQSERADRQELLANFAKELNDTFKRQKNIKNAVRVNELTNNIVLNHRLMKTADEKTLAQAVEVINRWGGEYAPEVEAGIGGQQFYTTTTEARMMRVSRHFYYKDAWGQMRLPGEARAARFGHRETMAFRGYGLEATEAYIRQTATATQHADTVTAIAQGNFRLFETLQGKIRPDHVFEHGRDGLRPLTGVPGLPGLLDVEGTILKPIGTRGPLAAGEVFSVKSPVALLRSDFSEKWQKRLPEQLRELPIAVQDFTPYTRVEERYYLDELSRKVRTLEGHMEDYRLAHGAREKLTGLPIATEDIGDIRRKIAKSYEEVLDMTATMTAGKKRLVTDALTAEMYTSARGQIRAISPLDMPTMARHGIGENTIFISERMAQRMLGPSYSEFWDVGKDAFDPETGLAKVKERMFGGAIRYPNIYRESVGPVNIQVARWATGDNIHVTPGMLAKMKGDADGDALSFFMSYMRGEDDRTRALRDLATDSRREIARYWDTNYGEVLQRIDLQDRVGEAFKHGWDPKTQRHIPGAVSHRLTDIMADEGIMRKTFVSTDEVMQAKMGKMFLGHASNISARIRFLSEAIYGGQTEPHRLIESLGASIEHSAFQMKHGGTATPLIFDIDDIFKQAQASGARDADFHLRRLLDITDPKDATKKMFTREQVDALTDMFQREFSTFRQELRPLVARNISGLDFFDFVDVTTDKGTRMLSEFRAGTSMDEFLRIARPEAKTALDVFAATEGPSAGELLQEQARQADLNLARKSLLPKITSQHVAWGIGIAAAIYAFQRVRNVAGIQPDTERPQPDTAPATDGYYGEDPVQMQPVIPRVIQDGTGYQGLRVRVRGVSNRTVENDMLGQQIADAMQGHIPIPMQVNVSSRDDRTNLNRENVERIVGQTIRGY